MNILLSANEGFAEYSKKLLLSIRNNNKDKISIYFFYMDLKPTTINEIKKYIETELNMKVYFYKIEDSIFDKLPKTNKTGDVYFGPEAYFRLFAQYFLPKNMDRILYLDIDILCDGSLKELYNMDFDSNYYIGCEDLAVTTDEKKRILFNNNDLYFNSGVLLINLSLLRKKIDINELKDFIVSKKNIISYPDQDIINMFYKNKIMRVDNKYNYTQFKKQNYNKNAILFHYIGKNKPWIHKSVYKIKFQFFKKYIKYSFLYHFKFEYIILLFYYFVSRPIYLLCKVLKKMEVNVWEK